MKNLLHNTAKRRVDLMNLFFVSSNRLSLKELSNQLNSSLRIIREDIDFLSKPPYNQYVHFDINDKGILAEFKDNVGLDKLAEFTLQEAVIFDIIEHLYYVGITTLEELANEFHLSLSTVYRELKKLNDEIADKFNLKISFKPIQIIGDESMIRSFFLQYFSERYSTLIWPFKDVDEKKLETFLKFFLDIVGRPIEFAMFKNVKLTAMISAQRYKQGFRVVKYRTMLDDVFEDPYKKMPDSHLFKTALTSELLNELFYKYVTDDFFYSYEDFLETATQQGETTQSFMLLTYILDSLSQKFNLPIPNKEELIYHLHSTAVLDTQEINAVYLLYDAKNNFHNFVKVYHPEFYKDSWQYFKEYQSKVHNNHSSTNLKHLLYTLFSHWESLFKELNRRERVYKAVVISSNDNYHSHMLKDILDIHLSENQLEISALTLSSIDVNALKRLNCDIIIANFTLPDIEKKKCFCIDNMPSYNDIQKIRRFIHFQKLQDHSNFQH